MRQIVFSLCQLAQDGAVGGGDALHSILLLGNKFASLYAAHAGKSSGNRNFAAEEGGGCEIVHKEMAIRSR
jgi:hypothetical protein